jgi:hypothetical protein
MRHHSHRTLRDVVHEIRLPAPERAAARSERQVEAAIRRERDNNQTAERRAGAIEAERRKHGGFYGHI